MKRLNLVLKCLKDRFDWFMWMMHKCKILYFLFNNYRLYIFSALNKLTTFGSSTTINAIFVLQDRCFNDFWLISIMCIRGGLSFALFLVAEIVAFGYQKQSFADMFKLCCSSCWWANPGQSRFKWHERNLLAVEWDFNDTISKLCQVIDGYIHANQSPLLTFFRREWSIK